MGGVRVLISYVTAGAGHLRAAEAIAEAARRRFPDAQVSCVDLLTDTPPWLRWAYPRIYEVSVRFLPATWGWAYHLLDHPWLFRCYQPWRRRWNQAVARRFARRLEGERPDVIVTTHFFPTDVLATLRRAGRLSARFLVVLTDLFPHRLWLASEADAMVVASEQTRRTCEQRGIRAERLHVCGVPVELRFSAPVDRPALRRQLGLDPSRTTLLLASGGMGYGPLEPIMSMLLSLAGARDPSARIPRPQAEGAADPSVASRLQALVVCGHNRALAQRLTRRCAEAPFPVRVFGFVETMPELMQASDLLVTKAGGITIMEALTVGVPMVLCGTIPGQESFNAEYVVAHGAAVNAAHPAEAVAQVLRLFAHPSRLEAMRHAAKSLSRPRAAEEIAALITS